MSVSIREWTKKDGTISRAYLVRYFDNDRKGRYKTFAKKRDALAYDTKVKGEVATGRHVSPRKSITVNEAAENWIARVDADNAERATIRQYRQHQKLHIAPRIGAVKLANLTSKAVENFRDDLMKSMSRAMAKKVLTSLKSILRVAKMSHLADD